MLQPAPRMRITRGMKVHTLSREQHLERPPAEVFAFFADARNLEAITPPALRFRVVTPDRRPYRLWHHSHTFEERGGGTLMRDVVRYVLPLWPLGEMAQPLVRRELAAIFDFRREAVARTLAKSLH